MCQSISGELYVVGRIILERNFCLAYKNVDWIKLAQKADLFRVLVKARKRYFTCKARKYSINLWTLEVSKGTVRGGING